MRNLHYPHYVRKAAEFTVGISNTADKKFVKTHKIML